DNTLKKVAGIADIAVPTFADWCVADLLDANGHHRAAKFRHCKPALEQRAREMSDRYPHRAEDPYGPGYVFRTGQSQLIAEVTDEILSTVAHDEVHAQLLREFGWQSVMCVPINAQGRTVGVLTFCTSESHRRFDAELLHAAEDVARRAAIA